jgi:hypothetical protein
MSEVGDYSRMKKNLSPYDYQVRQEKLVREYQISVESMKLVRDRLDTCVRTETVNQFVNCRDLREKYFALCQDNYNGMIFPEDAGKVNRKTPGLVIN